MTDIYSNTISTLYTTELHKSGIAKDTHVTFSIDESDRNILNRFAIKDVSPTLEKKSVSIYFALYSLSVQ